MLTFTRLKVLEKCRHQIPYRLQVVDSINSLDVFEIAEKHVESDQLIRISLE